VVTNGARARPRIISDWKLALTSQLFDCSFIKHERIKQGNQIVILVVRSKRLRKRKNKIYLRFLCVTRQWGRVFLSHYSINNLFENTSWLDWVLISVSSNNSLLILRKTKRTFQTVVRNKEISRFRNKFKTKTQLIDFEQNSISWLWGIDSITKTLNHRL